MLTLLHGTTANKVPDILRHGLRPRGKKKARHENVPSHPGRVYLSTAYALHYAAQFLDEGEDAAIIECRVDPANLLPDEDFLAEAMPAVRKQIPDRQARILYLRDNMKQVLSDPRSTALQGIAEAGTAAHVGAILPSSITRVAIVPGRDVIGYYRDGYDPVVTIRNYRFMQGRYAELHEQIMDKHAILNEEA